MKTKLQNIQDRLRKHQERQAEIRGEMARIDAQLHELGISPDTDVDEFINEAKEQIAEMKEEIDDLVEQIEELLNEYENN